jgi:hypothetical protein
MVSPNLPGTGSFGNSLWRRHLTLLFRGEENIYLDDFDVKLRKKLLCTLFKKKKSIPAETKNQSFLTSCSTSKNDVLTYIFNDLTSKVGPRRHSVAPISPGRGKNLPRWAPPLRLAVPVNIPISCRSHAIQSAGGGGFGLSRSFYAD